MGDQHRAPSVGPSLCEDFDDDESDDEPVAFQRHGRVAKEKLAKPAQGRKKDKQPANIADSFATRRSSASNRAASPNPVDPVSFVERGPRELFEFQSTPLNENSSTGIYNSLYATMTDNYVAPGHHRHLRACMVCSIVKTQNMFLRDGCPNCEDFLHLSGSMDAIIDCTSQVFEGLISLADPSKSWVAKWQRLDGYVKGVYATKVSGVLPDEVIAVMEDEARIRYIPRDGTASEAD